MPGSMPARSTTSSPASRIRSATAAKFPASHISFGSMTATMAGYPYCAQVDAAATLGRMDSIVTAADVHRRYGEGDAAVDALAGVSVGFERGNFSAIMGPSGSGKSTLMHILAGLDRPTSGTVTLDGEEITGLDDARPHPAAAGQARLRLPVLQPDPGPHRRGERDAAALDRRAESRTRSGSGA